MKLDERVGTNAQYPGNKLSSSIVNEVYNIAQKLIIDRRFFITLSMEGMLK